MAYHDDTIVAILWIFFGVMLSLVFDQYRHPNAPIGFVPEAKRLTKYVVLGLPCVVVFTAIWILIFVLSCLLFIYNAIVGSVE